MSRRKRYYRKKRKYKRGWNPYIKATAPAMGYVAMKAAEKVVKKYINTEFKYFDTFQDLVNMTETGGVELINLIPQSDSAGELGQSREGRQCKITSVSIEGAMWGNASADRDYIGRLELWIKKEVNGAAPTYASLYDYSISDGTTIDTRNRIHAPRNMDNIRNYRKLASRKVVFEKDGKTTHTFKIFHKFKNGLVSRWAENDTTGAVSTMESNLLFVVWISDRVTDAYPSLTFNTRLRFIDN